MSVNDSIARKLKALPDAPGVYLLKDARGAVLYVGKAKNLRSRVRSYFGRSTDDRWLLPFLRQRIADLDTIVVDNEKEAFLLENNLIKRHRPRYNVRLVDDKTYLSLRLDRSHPFPRFTTVRRRRRDGARYFGPYSSARSVRSTLKLVYRNFGIRSCSDSVLANRTRPCLYHQIGQCLAPCVDLVDRATYAEALRQAELFLAGRNRELLAELDEKMRALAAAERFEEAAQVRDRIRSVERTVERQNVAVHRDQDFDVIGHATEGSSHVFVWLDVRAGRVVDSTTLRVRDHSRRPFSEVLTSVLAQAYLDRPVPAEIVVTELPAEREILTEVLTDRREAAVDVRVPQRGSKRRLLRLASTNAGTTAALAAEKEATDGSLLGELQRLLGLASAPRRIECFDVSNLGGSLTVGAMSVAVDGTPRPAEYRRYRIRTQVDGDDYASMRELLLRRLTRAVDEGTMPDLLIVDGGRGQLAIARSVTEELGIEHLALLGLAKGPDRDAGREAIHLPDRDDPVRLQPADPRLHLLQRIRDEAHRFAITYNRRLRTKRDRGSVLSDVPGIGPARTRSLLRTFGSLAGVRRATAQQLVAAPGMTREAASRLWEHLHGTSAGADRVAEDDPPSAE